MLTPRQKQIFDFIEKQLSTKGVAPTHQEIAKHLKISSVGTVHEHLAAIQKKGYLEKMRGQARAIGPRVAHKTISIPLLGVIAAGRPLEATEMNDEVIEIPAETHEATKDLYALRVQGNSMITEGIFDGDIVVIRKQSTADNGQTVVAIIDDNETTLKKLYREKDGFRLQPSNPTLFPIFRKEVEVRGVVVQIIRNLTSDIEKKEKYTRRIDTSWDYRGENTKSYTHRMHGYPAMFIPQVARRLLETYSQPGDTVCDIFCGSGTALVESKLLARNAFGIDLNPLALFLANAKTTPLDPSMLTKTYFDILKKYDQPTHRVKTLQSPRFKNIEFWFKPEAIEKLSKLKSVITAIPDKAERNFFMVAFSETARYSSNTKTSEFKLVRMRPEKLALHTPDVLGIFKKRVERNIAGMSDFAHQMKNHSWTKIIHGDSSKENGIKRSTIDCIVTSPPYGDSRTTVAYGQFSRLSSQWIDVFDDPDKASLLDNDLLGGKPTKTLTHTLPSQYLNDALDKIAKQDEARAKDVLSFYIGLNDCIKRAHKILRTKKYFCLVIGNRMVKQIRIPTDFILAELAEDVGFTCEDIIVRNIPGKRMPTKNSPTNMTGALEETMNSESIVILRKN